MVDGLLPPIDGTQETTEVGWGMGTVALFQEPVPHLAHLYLQPLLSIGQPHGQLNHGLREPLLALSQFPYQAR